MATILEMEEKAQKLVELRADRDEKKRIYALADELVNEAEAEFMSILEENGISTYKSKVGTLTVVNRTSVKFPQDLEARRAFGEWAKEQGLFDQLFTVNSQTLNSLYKVEKAASEDRGELFFRLPGLEDPTLSSYLTFRKA